MAGTESYTSSNGLVKRPGSSNWYLRYTDTSGKRVYRTTGLSNYDDALAYAKRMRPSGQGSLTESWEKCVSAAMNTPASWLKQIIDKAVARAKKRHSKVRVKQLRKDLLKVVLRSNGYCELTGQPFSFDNPTGSRVSPFKPSIDRIDSSKGYSYENCRLILAAANMALADWGEAIFARMAVGYAQKQMHWAIADKGLDCPVSMISAVD